LFIESLHYACVMGSLIEATIDSAFVG
jgi:hypothetical protein